MRYSIEPIERRYVEGYGFLPFARNLGAYTTKATKNLNNKYGQKFVDSAKKYATDALKIAGKRGIQKTAEANGDLVGNKIADKITQKLLKRNQQMNHNQLMLAMKYQKKDIYLRKKDKKILMN